MTADLAPAGEEILRVLLESAKDSIFIKNTERRYTLANPAMAKLLGVELSEIIGNADPDLFGSEAEKTIAPADMAVLAGKIVHVTDALDVGGRTRIFDVAKTPTRNDRDEVTGILGIARDITERVRAEKVLRESERKYRELVENANSIILRWKSDGTVVFLNKFGLDFFGYREEEIIGRHVVGTIVPETESTGRDLGPLMDRICRDPAAFEQNVNENMRKDVSLVWVAWTNKAVLNERGEIIEIFSVGSDITDRKRAEEALKKLNDESEQRVAARTAELNNKVGEAEKLNRAMVNLLEDLQSQHRRAENAAQRLEVVNEELKSFSYTVSHDLRAPLRAMDGFSRALMEDYGESLDDRAGDYIARICGGAVHMGKMIDGLLALSRATRVELRRERVNLSALAAEVMEEFAEAERRIEVVIQPNMAAECDPTLIRLVIENLIGNAVKFTARRREARIDVGASPSQKAGESVFWVKDNGVGFDMAYANTLFGAFQRLHREEEFPGTGIGLATVGRIVARHGGRVWAEAEEGKGAAFFFTLGERSKG